MESEEPNAFRTLYDTANGNCVHTIVDKVK